VVPPWRPGRWARGGAIGPALATLAALACASQAGGAAHRSAPPAGAPGAGAAAGAPEAAAGAGRGFVHPGILVSRPMLDFVKAKIAAGAEPWTSALARASASRFGALTYAPHPRADVDCGSRSRPDGGCSDEKNDAGAAYTQALLWSFTGDSRYARNAVAIMNAWSSTLRRHTNTNAPLQSAWVAELFPRAAEIIRATYPGWGPADRARFAAMLKSVYLPEVAGGSASNGNWELSMIEAMMNISVFTDDRAGFERAVTMWRKRTPAYVYLTSDGPTPVPPPTGPAKTGAALTRFWYGQQRLEDGVAQETCRDLSHVQYGLAAMIDAAETARIQGVDLFREQARRLVAGLEFHAGLLEGGAVPTWLCGGALNRATPEPTWEIAGNALANVLGLALPRTRALIARIRPTGLDHHMAWESLTHADLGTVGLP
jgi:hypothetical protein